MCFFFVFYILQGDQNCSCNHWKNFALIIWIRKTLPSSLLFTRSLVNWSNEIVWHLARSMQQIQNTKKTGRILGVHKRHRCAIVIIMHVCCSFPPLQSTGIACCMLSYNNSKKKGRIFSFPSLFAICLLIELCWLSFYYFDTERQKKKIRETRRKPHKWNASLPVCCCGHVLRSTRRKKKHANSDRRSIWTLAISQEIAQCRYENKNELPSVDTHIKRNWRQRQSERGREERETLWTTHTTYIKCAKVNESQWFYVTAGTYYILLTLAIESVQSICLLHIIIFVLFLSLLYSSHKVFFVLFISNFSPSSATTCRLGWLYAI